MLKILSFITLAAAASLAFSAPDCHKHSLKIANSSQYPLSFAFMGGACSKEFGVIDAQTIKIISPKNFAKACAASPSSCPASVYATDNCNGDAIATLEFDTSKGVTKIASIAEGFRVSGNWFNLIFVGPW